MEAGKKQKKLDEDKRKERDAKIEKKLKEKADEIAPGMGDKITFISV